MIFTQVTHLPIIFQVDENILETIPYNLQRNKLNFNKILVVSGKSFSFDIASLILKHTKWDYYLIDDNTIEEVNKLKNYCSKNQYDLILGVGGGKVLDTVKRVSYLIRTNHIAVPTIISNDGLISPIAVIKNIEGKTESIPAVMPMGVIIDLDIIQTSPLKYLQAAAGDILSNFSATNDWILAYQTGKEEMNDLAFQMSRSSANALIYFKEPKFSFKPFIRQIVQGQVNSGIAMSLSGTSRPCSGSEHLISHAIDFLELSDETLHGTQVATISLFCLYLQKKLRKEHIDYALNTNIPLLFHTLSGDIFSNLDQIYETSKIMRPGRFTVIDEYSKQEFLDTYNLYVDTYSSVESIKKPF